MEKKKILIIEDAKPIAMSLQVALQDAGFEVEIELNGQEGLTKTLMYKPDLILLDIFMPKMDGIEMLEKLRADAWGKDARVVIFTNFPSNDRFEEVKKYDVIDLIEKSNMSLNEIVQQVKGYLE